MEFLIIFGILGIMCLPFMLMFLICGIDAKHKIGGAVFVLVFWFLFAGAMYGQEQGNNERWNGGYCPCGSRWELVAVDRSRNGTEHKYYCCGDCYKEIEIIH